MANTFQNTTLVARDAAIEFHGSLVAAGMIPDRIEQKFAQRVGETVTVKKRPIMTANRHDGSGPFTTSDISEQSVDVSIAHRAYVKHKLTAQEMTFNVDDFTLQVVRPAMIALAQDVDLYLIHNILVPGFARNVAGTEGNSPSTLAHLAAAWKTMFESELAPAGSSGILNSTAAANFLQLQQFINRDYGEEKPRALRYAMFSQIYEMNLYASNQAATQDRGYVTGTVLTDGTPTLASSTLHVDGFTAATGTTKKGCRFTVAGDTTVYTLTADATISGNECDFSITPTVSADLVTAGDGAALTFKAACQENVIFHPDAVARALIAPVPQTGNPSSVGEFEGISLRVTRESTINNDDTGDGEYILFDVFVGGNVIVPEGGCLLQG